MQILLVGGTGVLSSAITTEALKQGIHVTMINRGNNLKDLPNGIHLIKSDRKNYNNIRSQLHGQKFDAVIDFLCYTQRDTEESFNLYKDFTEQYFFISSCAVYDTRLGIVCSEDSPKVLPMWTYSVEKWDSELHLINLAKSAQTNYTIIRPCVTYGNTRIPYGISPTYGYHWTLAARILADKPIIRWNEGKNRCNMTRVEDFAIGVVGLIGNPKAYNEAFNVCGEETPSFNDVLNEISAYLKKDVVVFDISSEEYAKEIPSRSGEILGGRSIDAINSNNKIKQVVPEFKQTLSLSQGIHKTLSAYINQNYQKGIDWKFDAETDRIIKKFSDKEINTGKKYKIGFVDYLGTATFADKLTYWFEFYKENRYITILLRVLSLSLRIIYKCKRFISAK